MNHSRKVKRIVKGMRTIDGAGVRLTRVLGNEDVLDIDPFLMLDAFDSSDPADYMKGFPLHPHRGIETFTYLISGAMDHRDTLGNAGRIEGGQAQWMNAGGGILHEEMPVRSQRLWGLQLWINLPRDRKMSAPSYRDLRAEDMPKIQSAGATISVVAGSYQCAAGATGAHVQPTLLDVELKPGAQISIALPEQDGAFAYMLAGFAALGGAQTRVDAQSAAILTSGDELTVVAGDAGARFMLFSGAPLHEPIAWGGPIVMNTQDELRAAFRELEAGTFIAAHPHTGKE